MSLTETTENNQPILNKRVYRTNSGQPLMRVLYCPICNNSYGLDNQAFIDPYAPGQHYCGVCIKQICGQPHPTDRSRIIIPDEWIHVPSLEDQTPEPIPPAAPPPPNKVKTFYIDTSGSTDVLLTSCLGSENAGLTIFDVIRYLIHSRINTLKGKSLWILPITIDTKPKIGPLTFMADPIAYSNLLTWLNTLRPNGGTNFVATFQQMLQQMNMATIWTTDIEVYTDGAFDNTILPLSNTIQALLDSSSKITVSEMTVIGVGYNADLKQAASIKSGFTINTLPLPSSDPETALSTLAVFYSAQGTHSSSDTALLNGLWTHVKNLFSNKNFDLLLEFINTLPETILALAIKEEFKIDGTLWNTISTYGKPQCDNCVSNMIQSLITCLGKQIMPTLGPINAVLYPTLATSMAPYAIYAAENPLVSYQQHSSLQHSTFNAPELNVGQQVLRTRSVRAPSHHYAEDGTLVFSQDIIATL